MTLKPCLATPNFYGRQRPVSVRGERPLNSRPNYVGQERLRHRAPQNLPRADDIIPRPTVPIVFLFSLLVLFPPLSNEVSTRHRHNHPPISGIERGESTTSSPLATFKPFYHTTCRVCTRSFECLIVKSRISQHTRTLIFEFYTLTTSGIGKSGLSSWHERARLVVFAAPDAEVLLVVHVYSAICWRPGRCLDVLMFSALLPYIIRHLFHIPIHKNCSQVTLIRCRKNSVMDSSRSLYP